MNVVTRGVRNAFRNRIRTFSVVVILGLSIGLSLTMLIARQAVTDKIATVKSSVGNTISVSPAGARGFDGGGTPLTENQVTALAQLANVKSVDESLSDRLTTTNSSLVSAVEAGALGRRFGQDGVTAPSGTGPTPQTDAAASDTAVTPSRSFTPPVTVVGTTNPTNLSTAQGGGTFSLTSGEVIDGSSTDNIALVGSTLATKNNLKVGSTFTAYGATVTVTGIFDAGNTFANNQVIMPLKSVQTLSAQTGAITSATIYVNSVTNIDSVTAAAQKALGTAADITNSATATKQSVAPLENIQTISLYSLIGSVTAGAVIILLTMVMIVRERRREIGVTKAIGASNVNVVTQFASEAVTFTLLGSVVGVIFGILAGNPITQLLVNNSSSTTTGAGPGGPGGMGGRGVMAISRNISNVTASIGWEIILYGLLIALLIAIIGSALASFAIAKIRPAEVMRAE